MDYSAACYQCRRYKDHTLGIDWLPEGLKLTIRKSQTDKRVCIISAEQASMIVQLLDSFLLGRSMRLNLDHLQLSFFIPTFGSLDISIQDSGILVEILPVLHNPYRILVRPSEELDFIKSITPA